MAVKYITRQSRATTANLLAVMASKPHYNRKEATQLAGIGLRALDRPVADSPSSVRQVSRRVLITHEDPSQFIKRDRHTGVIL
jgi:hypothetical protein